MAAVKIKKRRRHGEEIRKRAIALREAGKTHREIEKELGIPRSLAVQWAKHIALTEEQKKDIQRRKSEKIYTPERRAEISRQVKMYLSMHPRRKYSDDDLLQRIKDFYKANGRMPLKREFNTFRIYKKRFGSWNAAIRKAGFDPNPELFAHKFTAKDGHRCDSFTERVIDDWLFENKIKHGRHIPYAGTKRITADFYIKPNIFIEFFGLSGEQKRYDEMVKKKRILAQQNQVRLIEIFPQDIYPKNKLPSILANLM